ncbi:hypothetical protein [Candidatus Berkiella aquae]|uniref:Glycosyltransferase RgtA/B/C/D-like domain-containing protein n=1 Tax=Candidatus Berkiella aquae TaxID=295108 RepID=A0A0Q9YI29_9GAMM|nr:hypothetical protein [Candidatus Berkiella aquae]MCS5712300.1 hypothetical protein [Candidatus Berkiella aquae]
MPSQSNKTSAVGMYYFLLILLAGLRVIITQPKGCPAFFDCNSYLAMMQSIAYDPNIAGHHAMRVLPVLLANGLSYLGFSDEMAFRILSGGGYVAFGVLLFWFFQKCSLKSWVAFGFTLLCLAANEAIRIPLVLVYQTCDMFTYLFIILMFYCSLTRQTTSLFVLSMLSILTRQNLLILGVASLLYCYSQTKQRRVFFYTAVLITAYSFLQSYYHATSTFTALLQPPAGFFTFSHLWFVVIDSKVLELFVPLLPFLLLYAKSMIQLMLRYWHLTLYMAITIGQPFLGYHMTGNNFARIALQGVIGLYLLAGMASAQYQWSKAQIMLFLGYALLIYTTWGITYRLGIMVLFSVVFVWMLFKQHRQSSSLLSSNIQRLNA